MKLLGKKKFLVAEVFSLACFLCNISKTNIPFQIFCEASSVTFVDPCFPYFTCLKLMIYFFIGFLTFLFWLLFVKFIIIWTIFEAFLKEDKIWWSVLWYGNTEQCYKMASHGLNREPQTKSIAFTVLLL